MGKKTCEKVKKSLDFLTLSHYSLIMKNKYNLHWPTEAGQYRLASTGEVATAVKQSGDIIALFIGKEGPFYCIDLLDEKFEEVE